jgi:hypothetical protein
MNATRFYWAKLEGAKNLFLMSKTEETSKTEKTLHKVQNTCCELINEFRCPRFAQIEAHVGTVDNTVCPKLQLQLRYTMHGF